MQIDPDTVRWFLSGMFFIGGTLISWLLSRQVAQLDEKFEKQGVEVGAAHGRIDRTNQTLADAQLDIAKNYVSKMELKEQLESQLGPLRSDMRDIKDDVKALLKRP
ncbi:hypothetical protein [Zavarzinella formosa]|uniref:hypothetical protein n=1 Tax=Zavarzinella formosa TaxID=360055 RepID=UPI00030289B6|nr:hypothetical protein [Zavarzinella formosa]